MPATRRHCSYLDGSARRLAEPSPDGSPRTVRPTNCPRTESIPAAEERQLELIEVGAEGQAVVRAERAARRVAAALVEVAPRVVGEIRAVQLKRVVAVRKRV